MAEWIVRDPAGKGLRNVYGNSFFLALNLAPKQRAVLRFQPSETGNAEVACLIHEIGTVDPVYGGLNVVHEVGTPPYRNFNDRQITTSGSYVVVGWAKRVALPNYEWNSSFDLKDHPPPPGYTHKFTFWKAASGGEFGLDHDVELTMLVFIEDLSA